MFRVLVVSMLIVLGLSVPLVSNAEGIAVQYTVKNVRVDQSGKGKVSFTEDLTGTQPACVTTHTKDLAFDTNTEAGRAIYSLALTAFATGKVITGRGTNSCTIYSATEDWSWGHLREP